MSADAAPAKTAAPAKAVAPVKAAAPKVKKVAKPAATGPSHVEMITAAITALGGKKGSSMASIKTHIRANHTGIAEKKIKKTKECIKRMVKLGKLTQTKGTGALANPPRPLVLGLFKLPVEEPKKAAKSPKKAAKSPKKDTKSPKKAAKSPKQADKKSVKKVTKDAKSPKKATKSPKKEVTKAAKPAKKAVKSPKKAAKSPAKKPVAKKAKKPAVKKAAAKK